MDLNNITKIPNFSSTSFFKESGFKFVQNSNIYDQEFQLKNQNSNPMDIIQFSHQFLKNEDWLNISKMITEKPNIHTIELSGISIDDFGLKILGEIVEKNHNVKTVKLEWNYLNEHSKDFAYFCDCLSRSNLTYLYLNNNKITSHLCTSISKILKDSQSIMYIDLRWNDISNEGAKNILTNLQRNTIIQELNLIGNKVSGETLAEISEILRKNKNNIHSALNIKDDNKLSRSNFMKSGLNFNRSKSPEKENNLTVIRDYENVPLKFLEKEKELSEEFKARYDVQLITNAKLEKKNKELETLIELERNKVSEAKETFDKDLEAERNLRIKYEEQIAFLKEDLMRSAVDKKKIENEYDVKFVALNNQILNLQNENKTLKDNLNRTTETYEEKYILLKEEYESNYRHLNDKIESLKQENEKIRRESTDEIKNNLKDFEKKYKTLEETFRSLKVTKEELERTNVYLKKEMLDVKIEAELKFKEKESQFIDDEKKKSESVSNYYEQKIKVLESTKEELIEKNNRLYQELNTIKKNSTDEQIVYENKMNDINIEKISISKNCAELNSEVNKINVELSTRNALIVKLQNQIGDMKRTIEENNKKHSDKLTKMQNEKTKDKKLMESENRKHLNKIDELEKSVTALKQKLARLETDDIEFSEMFKNSITKLIDNSC